MELELVGGVLAILAAMFSAVRFYFVRKATSSRGPVRIVLISFLMGTLLFVPVSLLLNYPDFGLSRIGFSIFVIVGLLLALFLNFAYESVRRIGASRTSPITRGNMLIASLIAVLFLSETVEVLHLVGIIVLFLGVALVSYETGEEKSDSESLFSLDLIFPLSAMIFGGVNSVSVSLGYAEGVPITVGITIQLLTSLIVMVLLFLYKGWPLFRFFRAPKRSLYVWAGIAFVAMLACWNLALNIAPVVVVQPLMGTAPLFVLLISYFYLKRLEEITKILVIGAALTVLGGVLVGVFM